MKLPEWGTLLRDLTPSESALAEAIVRDCIQVCKEISQEQNQDANADFALGMQNGALHCVKRILGRYGLGEKT